DLEPYQLKVGEHVRYRVQARDRKGQIAETREFVVRIAADPSAADRQLAGLAAEHDSFQQKLAQLIREQSKITESVSGMAATLRKPAPRASLPEAAPSDKGQQRLAPTAAPQAQPGQAPANDPSRTTDRALS